MTAFRNDCLTTTRNGASISKCNWLKVNIRMTAVPLKLQHGVHISALIDTPLFDHSKYRQNMMTQFRHSLRRIGSFTTIQVQTASNVKYNFTVTFEAPSIIAFFQQKSWKVEKTIINKLCPKTELLST